MQPIYAKLVLFAHRYRADDVTGYVAEVTYEGVAKPYQPPTRA